MELTDDRKHDIADALEGQRFALLGIMAKLLKRGVVDQDIKEGIGLLIQVNYYIANILKVEVGDESITNTLLEAERDFKHQGGSGI